MDMEVEEQQKPAVISLGGIVSNRSIKVAGDEFTNDIVDYAKSSIASNW